MLDYLETFDITGANICFLKNKEVTTITIHIPDIELSYNQKVAFFVVADYFKKFLSQYIENIFDKIENKTRKKNLNRDDNIIDIALPCISEYFRNYITKFEIEIACDIEREKSPCYSTNYMNKEEMIKNGIFEFRYQIVKFINLK